MATDIKRNRPDPGCHETLTDRVHVGGVPGRPMDQDGDPAVSVRSRLVAPEGQLRAIASLKALEFWEVAAIDRTPASDDRLQFWGGTNRGGNEAGHDERGGADGGQQHYEDAQQP